MLPRTVMIRVALEAPRLLEVPEVEHFMVQLVRAVVSTVPQGRAPSTAARAAGPDSGPKANPDFREAFAIFRHDTLFLFRILALAHVTDDELVAPLKKLLKGHRAWLATDYPQGNDAVRIWRAFGFDPPAQLVAN